MHAEELNKLRAKDERAKDERRATAHPVQKVSIGKVKEEKMNFETMFTQSLPVTLRSRGQLVLNCLKQHSNIISWKEEGQMIYKDDAIENSNMIDLLTWMIKLKPNNTNQISPFVSLLFAKSIAECNVPLELIKNKDMMTMVKIVKESDEEQMQDTPITSSKIVEKPDEIQWEEFKPYKRSRKTKKLSVPWRQRRMRWREFLKRIRCLLACCNSQIVVENSQLDGKPPENEQGGATEETIL